MSKPNKQTAAQREAKRLYKVFLNAFNNRIPLNVDPLRAVKDDLAKEAAIVATRQIEKVVNDNFWNGNNTIKHYRDVRREIKKL